MDNKIPNGTEAIVGRIDVLINLMFQLLEKNGKAPSARDKIIMLNSFGLSPKDIAKIINSNTNHVSVELSIYRSKEKKKQTQKRGFSQDEENNESGDVLQ